MEINIIDLIDELNDKMIHPEDTQKLLEVLEKFGIYFEKSEFNIYWRPVDEN